MREKRLLWLISLGEPHPTNCIENHQFSCQSRCSADKQQMLWVVVWMRTCRACVYAAELYVFGPFYDCCVWSNCVWELFWWSVGGSCKKEKKERKKKKDSRSACAKGQVLDASALAAKSHLRQKKAEWVDGKGPWSPHLEHKSQKWKLRCWNSRIAAGYTCVYAPLNSCSLPLLCFLITWPSAMLTNVLIGN